MEITDRIHDVAAELCAIQNELNQMLMAGISEGDGSPALRQAAAIAGVADLKLVIDQMRQFLWFFLQVVSGTEVGQETAQMLRKLSLDPRMARIADAVTFLQQFNASNEYALVRVGADGRRKPN
jgi:hypothetical protein